MVFRCSLGNFTMSKLARAARILAGMLVLLTAVGMSGPPSLAANCPGAGVVKNAGQAFMAAARSGSAAAFSSALARHADISGTALFALGQYRNDLPPARQREYFRNTQAFMARFLLNHATSFRSARDLIIESCKGGIVETSLGGRSRMVWRLSGGRIRDVRVSGVWLTLQLRSKFTGVIRRNRGDIRALLDFLRRSGN